ncbi:MAG: hypothetical protein D8M59_06760 [Planctomycetes bacterium]|nr:hypothetical protein [Planctomycetota bacterium]
MAGLCSVGLGLTLAAGSAFAAGNELAVNNGYELVENTVGFLPDAYGDWRGDFSQITVAQDGIIPFEGVEMLQLIDTSFDVSSKNTVASEVWQLIDLTSVMDVVQTGTAELHGEAYFNRIAGDQLTDTRFSVMLSAYSGSTADFSDMWSSGSHLAQAQGIIYTDADTQTWELAEINLVLPAETDYVALRVAAVEDSFNDLYHPEFAGHYADASAVWLVPSPAAASLLLAGCGLTMGGRRRRKTA